MGVRVQPVPVEAVRPLRHAVLRPHQGFETVVYPSDDAPGALHVAAFDGDERIVGVGSIGPDPHSRDPRPGDWRIRGMAAAPEVRGRGVGAEILRALLEHARAQGAERAWCNARAPARTFYEREGLTVEGERFELPDIGWHLLMSTWL
jgi:GNAT superfamily N-acetyltransferase